MGYVKKDKKIDPNPLGALPLNVIKGGVSAKRGEHQAVQPGYLPEKYIKACTKEGDIVVDPWLGTGTTGIECIKLGRQFYGFDIVKEYVDEARSNISELYKQIDDIL